MPALTTPADPLALLESLPAPPFLVRLASLPGRPQEPPRWRLEISEDNGGSWSSLEAGKSGHPSPGSAIEIGSQAIGLWRLARADVEQVEVAHFFIQGKLERRKILTLDLDQSKTIEIDGYAAQAEDGTWIEDPSPIAAIEKAKDKKSVKSSPQSSSKQG